MADLLKPINPLEYITERDPVPERVLDVSGWFKTETMDLTFGEYVGRPDAFIDLHKSDLLYYIGNGWYVDSVIERGEKGAWRTGASSMSQNTGSSYTDNSADSVGAASTTGDSASSRSGSVGDSGSTSVSSTTGSGTAIVSQDGGPYWAAWTKIRLKRRRMQSELVLKDMIAQFTKAYNEGREVNNERYDELVSLYAIMLSRTEDEANAFTSLNIDDFKPLAKAVTDAVKEALENYRNSVVNIPDDWLQSRIDEINRKFDALIGTTRTDMVSKGTYNSTVWPTTEAGIERQRQYALNDLKDKMVDAKVDVYGRIATLTADIGNRLIECETRLIEASKSMLLGPTEARNTVFKWMLDFMERRDDEYPGLEAIMGAADRLGYSDGATSGPTGGSSC